ncbi:sterol carrier family protein [Streptomyces sp. WI04-05B]|uniref:maleylpyruvate isomerase family mycothiol-dependent enzyme n=1 Tax=Streptomyces TaxID=1883 RepID=UPI0029A23075|nr:MULTISPECIES: sterol carrier family protein [unclassified Streptomyces]MDX2542767.1 sterol carrier family protein [Streptomyces sp. WI04-05B]MDX2588311.1 sterol carrier family protein [Streptomyces sp. WI04-05A]MDX3747412.1 sterol carrier family protein [Streptomyces sp. AK08-02]
MPPARKPKPRPRTYDPVKTRTAVLTQYANIRTAVSTLTPDQLALPTRLGDWTVRDLVAHITMALGSISLALDRDEPAKAEIGALDYTSVTAPFADAIAEGSRDLAERTPDLNALLARTEERLTELLTGVADTRVLAVRVGAVPLTDYLVTRTVELIVHTDDLNAAVPGLDIPYDKQALATCTRLLADALAAKAPGGSTEVRIPPYAVVQCVEGPRHTRGTPPNVVETDPLTWIRLATGRVRWADALDNAQVSASGERADLGELLPLMA